MGNLLVGRMLIRKAAGWLNYLCIAFSGNSFPVEFYLVNQFSASSALISC